MRFSGMGGGLRSNDGDEPVEDRLTDPGGDADKRGEELAKGPPTEGSGREVGVELMLREKPGDDCDDGIPPEPLRAAERGVGIAGKGTFGGRGDSLPVSRTGTGLESSPFEYSLADSGCSSCLPALSELAEERSTSPAAVASSVVCSASLPASFLSFFDFLKLFLAFASPSFLSSLPLLSEDLSFAAPSTFFVEGRRFSFSRFEPSPSSTLSLLSFALSVSRLITISFGTLPVFPVRFLIWYQPSSVSDFTVILSPFCTDSSSVLRATWSA